MNIRLYIKERWLTLLFFLLVTLFTYSVYKLDTSLTLTQTSEAYILMGWLLFLCVFSLLDYVILTQRVKKINQFSELHASNAELEDFTYPLDATLAKQIEKVVYELETYRNEIETRTAEELDFITKWIHDIKVPIAAARLIIESEEETLPPNLYDSISRELFSIEESAQRVFMK
ncbi:hypothetical protein [Bacillus sp. JCM 19034]|uniref:hypothetical protein n=1 Tax=Bacillus sp. JCM 19034 TaxID=1481928 RepID=UPI000AFD5CBD|nr:hypothetical protein [Bacillus sp. JCM 19034]